MSSANHNCERLEWSRFFSPKNRIEANHVSNHLAFPAHDHEFMEFQVICGGTCRYRSSAGGGVLRAGDVFLFRPGAWHTIEAVDRLDLYNCCFDSAMLAREMAWMLDHPAIGALLWSIPLAPQQHGIARLHLPADDLRNACAILDTLCAVRGGAAETFLERMGLLFRFLGVLARRVPEDWLAGPPARPHIAVSSALRLIDEQPDAGWTLAALAERSHVTPAYFVRLFRRSVGLTPMAYLMGRRLELASGLLRSTVLPMGEVGQLVGLPDPSHFSRRFRARFGVTPSGYRERFVATAGPPSAEAIPS